MKESPIIVEQTYRAKIERVWQAITEKEQMTQWFFDSIHAFKPEPGFETEFNVMNGDKIYPHLWRVKEVVPERKLSIEWKYGGYSGTSLVTFLLSASGDQTKLTLTHEGHESFPRDNPDFSRENGVAGWTFFIKEQLPEFLERN